MIIDTDMAADDWLAILYLLMRPDVDVKAITVTGAGEAHCGQGTRNARNLLALAGRPDIPVTCGREKPLEGTHAFPQAWREAVDNLLGLELASTLPLLARACRQGWAVALATAPLALLRAAALDLGLCWGLLDRLARRGGEGQR